MNRIWLTKRAEAPAGPAGEFRERIKACELDAEAIQQALLVAAIAVPEGEGERIKANELKSEAIEQDLLAAAIAVPEGSGEPAVTAGNMTRYFGVLGITPSADDTADLADVLRGCHPELPPLDAVWLLSG